MSNENKMYELGEKYGTDKISHHNYHKIYPQFIEKFYDKSGGIVEVGLEPLWGQASLQLWLELFPSMHIYGLDRGTPDKATDRYTIFKCDQSKEEDLDRCLQKIEHPIYFICDDGSHIPEHQLLTFNKLFPKLEIGGVYIIEDVETSYWVQSGLYGYETRYGKDHPKSIIEIFKKVVDGVNREFSDWVSENVLHQNEIASVTFAKNCIILVRGEPEELRQYRFADHVANG